MNRGKEKVKIIINFFDAYANINLKELSILEKEKVIYSDNKMRNRKYYYYNLLDLLR